ncbi:hypothetical protein D3C78_1832690 [compost metagenome]
MLDVFVNRLISQGKLVELIPGWQTYGRTFFTVTPKPRLAAPRRPAPRASVWGCIRGARSGGEELNYCAWSLDDRIEIDS